ncbi:glycosyltransferase [Siccirubricoccus sp. G192]|uniref:glycosyltransferase n=1 Tax=Siccirubricoccus sp. G192 TaxID=2849651 RepID=UPI001C2C6419|nr:glycosyltransferase [Siccirubricoccus sp. G192]
MLRQRAAAKDCPILDVAESFALDPRSLMRLAELCRRHDVRIWHGHDYKTNLFGVLLQPFLGFRLVSTVHGWVSQEGRLPLYYGVDRWALRRHERVIAVSQDLLDLCRAAKIPERVLHLVENAIDTEDFRRRGPAAASSRRAGMPPGRLVVGAVGRLSQEKGFDLLVEAAGALLSEGIDFELWIAGEGSERDRLAELAERTGQAERIRLLGFQSDLKSLFEAFDIFCLSSRREGLPNVLLEAMAMEVPAIATRAGGVEAFTAGRDDILTVPVEDGEALAEGLRSLLQTPALRHSLATSARKRVEQECGFQARMRKMASIYDEIH